MTNFKIELGGLDLLKKQLQANDTLKLAVPDMSVAVLQLHNKLEQRVAELFNMPTKLSSVMIGTGVKPVDVGKTFLRYSLQYRRKAIPLSNFRPLSVSKTIVRNAIPVIRANGSRGQIPINKARITKVQVRRGKSDNSTRNPQYFYYAKKKRILARNQKDTWDTFPELDANGRITKGSGDRAAVRQIFGPALSEVASKIYDKDSQVKRQIDLTTDAILQAIVKAYYR